MGKLYPWYPSLFEQGFRKWSEQMKNLWDEQGKGIRSDYYQTDQEVVVVVEIPGLSPMHAIEVKVVENILFIQGTMQEKGEETGFLSQSSFLFNLLLPAKVDPTRIKTDFEQDDGVLTLRLPKV
ncbi:Hsp20/alpha crystallin family protein [Kroppenstedtia pulmonis]|uniref:Hsp20/alpha crystallin family protein n=1 Tax=Kroppenstedtia pulmonis TaxID=1380685 RepID=A0A7D3XHW7_9BACL|nr:Hsp20/alpha crystallin family protein [Kroppenstedtia pulmonis]QKG84004.1 Hsp20/alpha crystallin family protein [Kroppenstedtia pulmonis]